jgi:putative RNA 2'-phosphotransferase
MVWHAGFNDSVSKYNQVQLSKFLSLVLRHKPQALGLTMEQEGWVGVDELIDKAVIAGKPLTLEVLKKIVREDEKQRYAFNEDETKIRASQGHSIDVDLKLEPADPPEFLYHGTAQRNIESIKHKGLLRQQRHHVHLSQDRQTAKQVGARYGKPVVLAVLAGQMAENGYLFFKSPNNVWLTAEVPAKYIQFP